MDALTSAFGSLVRHTTVHLGQPLPPARPGIEWLWAGNGVWKRGATKDLTICIPVGACVTDREELLTVPGLAALLPSVQWTALQGRIDGRILYPLLADAQAAQQHGHLIEKQYFIVAGSAGGIRLIAPRAQSGSVGRVHYRLPSHESILVDIHSHHTMRAFFSATDDADDCGLSVSVVIGCIDSTPELRCRLNVYGHRTEITPYLIFDQLGPFTSPVFVEGTHATLNP